MRILTLGLHFLGIEIIDCVDLPPFHLDFRSQTSVKCEISDSTDKPFSGGSFGSQCIWFSRATPLLTVALVRRSGCDPPNHTFGAFSTAARRAATSAAVNPVVRAIHTTALRADRFHRSIRSSNAALSR